MLQAGSPDSSTNNLRAHIHHKLWRLATEADRADRSLPSLHQCRAVRRVACTLSVCSLVVCGAAYSTPTTCVRHMFPLKSLSGLGLVNV